METKIFAFFMKMMRNGWLSLLALTSAALSVTAAPLEFDFKDPKGVNNATFKLDAPLESISGSANGVSGTVKFDPAKPEEVQGKIIVDASTLHVGNPLMLEHLRGRAMDECRQVSENCF